MASGLLIPALQAFSITSAGFLSGFQIALSTCNVPSILDAPAALQPKQWATMYNIGVVLGPPTGVISSLSSFYLAYALSESKYAIAGGFALGIIPYTILVMRKTNSAIFVKEKQLREVAQGEKVSAAEEKEVRDLVKFWGQANFVRGLFPLVGALVGAWTVIG